MAEPRVLTEAEVRAMAAAALPPVEGGIIVRQDVAALAASHEAMRAAVRECHALLAARKYHVGAATVGWTTSADEIQARLRALADGREGSE